MNSNHKKYKGNTYILLNIILREILEAKHLGAKLEHKIPVN